MSHYSIKSLSGRYYISSSNKRNEGMNEYAILMISSPLHGVGELVLVKSHTTLCSEKGTGHFMCPSPQDTCCKHSTISKMGLSQ